MSPEKQRIAIAQACGWTQPHKCPCGEDLCDAWMTPDGSNWEPLPDYLNDLNAMHEAEKVLTDKQHQAFRNELAEVCGFNYNRVDLSDPNHHRNYCSATAAQRAEAFLRTLGLWEDAP